MIDMLPPDPGRDGGFRVEEGDVLPLADMPGGNELSGGPETMQVLDMPPADSSLLLEKGAVDLARLVSDGALHEEQALDLSDAIAMLQYGAELHEVSMKPRIRERTRRALRATSVSTTKRAEDALREVFGIYSNGPDLPLELMALKRKLRDPESIKYPEVVQPRHETNDNTKPWDELDPRQRAAGEYLD